MLYAIEKVAYVVVTISSVAVITALRNYKSKQPLPGI